MWELIRQNRRRSWLILVCLATVLVGLGAAIGLSIAPPYGWRWGVLGALVLWAVMAAAAYSQGQKMVLRLARAIPVNADVHPVLHNVTEEMMLAANLPEKPTLYVTDDSAPNAFATGSDPANSSIVVTAGLLQRLNRDELQAVIAHELAHIVNQDTRLLTTSGVMLGTIVMLSDMFMRSMWIGYGRSVRMRSRSTGKSGTHPAWVILAVVFALLAPLFAQLLHLALSRQREYLADACAALYTRYPEALASALEKLGSQRGQLHSLNRITAPMYIVSPLRQLSQTKSRSLYRRLKGTHPPLEARIAILRDLANVPNGQLSLRHFNRAYVKNTGTRQMPFSDQAIADFGAVSIRHGSPDGTAVGEANLHAEMDLVRAASGFQMIPCHCGVRIKVPPAFAQSSISCPRCGSYHSVHEVSPADTAALDASLVPEPHQPATNFYQRKSTGWESFDCSCGRLMQLSPSLGADRLRCPACGAITRIESAQRQA